MSALVRSMNVLRGGILCRFNTDIGSSPEGAVTSKFKDVVGELAEKGQLAAIDQLGISSLTFIPSKSSSVVQNAYRALASFNTTSRYHQTVQFPFLQSRFLSTHQQGSSLPSLSLPNSSDVISAVSSDINQGRLFAVIYISGVQHKVTTGDLILLQNHIQADVGDRIRLEKVLLLGGDNFTLIGKPMLSLDTVRVEATVIEKTISEKKVHFRFKRRKRVARYRETYTNLTVLRINSIEAKLR